MGERGHKKKQDNITFKYLGEGMKFKLNFIGILFTLNILLISALKVSERRDIENYR